MTGLSNRCAGIALPASQQGLHVAHVLNGGGDTVRMCWQRLNKVPYSLGVNASDLGPNRQRHFMSPPKAEPARRVKKPSIPVDIALA